MWLQLLIKDRGSVLVNFDLVLHANAHKHGSMITFKETSSDEQGKAVFKTLVVEESILHLQKALKAKPVKG